MESVVLTGPNGAGKTSILEALSMLAPGRGLRRARLSELARRSDGTSAAGWSVAMRVRTPERSIDIRTVWTGEAAGGGRERRQLTIDGLPTKSQAALSETVALIWLTPDMDGLFTEGTGVRRRFLDRLVFGLDPAHAARTNAHDRAVLQRSTLLRQPRPDPVWLAAIEERIAGDAVAIVAARREVAARLSPGAGRRGQRHAPAPPMRRRVGPRSAPIAATSSSGTRRPAGRRLRVRPANRRCC
jgi:Recombinational DNA repair ATPase (RecF pathway)